MDIKNRFSVMSIPREQISDWLLNKHYAKSIPAIIIHQYGLFDENGLLSGVCVYGIPATPANAKLGRFETIELVRLVVNDGLEKNALSFFVSQTFKLLPSPITLISYADEGRGHHGYIYQATNWLYTGKGGGTTGYKDQNGREVHGRYMSHQRVNNPGKSREELAKIFKWEKVKGTYKFRYYYFIGNKKEKKEMMQSLLERYSIEPYPKGDNKRYDSSYKPDVQLKLF